MEITIEQLEKQLNGFECAIYYDPMKNEVDFHDLKFTKKVKKFITLPQNKESSYDSWARQCIEKFENDKVFILMPGRVFDKFGMRIGHGLGWYDKFLALVPTSWCRIGIADESQLTPDRLKQEPWDQPVDWLAIKSANSWKFYETNARN